MKNIVNITLLSLEAARRWYMIEAGIENGALVVVRPHTAYCRKWWNYFVVNINGEATIKVLLLLQWRMWA